MAWGIPTAAPIDALRGSEQPPDEAWLFAQALLGRPIPSPSAARAEGRAKREQLAWLASVSTDHERQLRTQLSRRSAAVEERERLEWLASFSPRHERELRRMQAAEAEVRTARVRYEQLFEDLCVQEADWDPSKHPRLGGPPNAGWFATTGTSSSAGDQFRALPANADVGAVHFPRRGLRAMADTLLAPRRDSQHTPSVQAHHHRLATRTGSKQVIQQASTRGGVGHHWAPKAVVFDPEIRPLLSDEAVEYAMGSYSGPTDPSHNYGTFGGVRHPDYNAAVKTELKKYMKLHKIKKMTVEQMQDFIDLINSGRGANGTPHPQIAAFNNAIKRMVPKDIKVPKKVEDILAAGRKYMKHPRFRVFVAAAVISGVLSEAILKTTQLADLAGKSGHYRRAIKALEDGDLDRAKRLLIGDDDSLYMEILLRLDAKAALDFKKAIEKVFESARNAQYK
ncbi:MAG: hypothetical protein AB7O59_11040 [Pirellulales bacterium]